jgi:RNA recognition motif-containing protein
MYIYVSNFNDGMTVEKLRTLFEPFGTVSNAKVADLRFAILEMPDSTDANKAIAALDGTHYQGKRLIVNECGFDEGRDPFPKNAGD